MPRPAGHQLNREAFQDLLDRTGLTLTEVADRADLPRSTLSALLGGFSKAAAPNAHRIALAIGCRPATLFPTLLPDFKAASKSEAAA
jgi:transcriptional regulator with XRE-family HTH domain